MHVSVRRGAKFASRGVAALGVVLAVAAAGPVHTSAAATAQVTATTHGKSAFATKSADAVYPLVGTWTAQVTTTVPSSGTVTYVFADDGTMTLTAGTASISGVWWPDSSTAFSFEIDHPVDNSSGALTGFLHAIQHGVLDSGSFTSSGTTTSYDLSGDVVQRFNVYITATLETSAG